MSNHQHQLITVRNEDGSPRYRDCVERGCTHREHPVSHAVTYVAANGRLVTAHISALRTDERAVRDAIADAGIERGTIRTVQVA